MSAHDHESDRRAETIPVAQKLAYGAGNFASLTTGYGISSLANYVFNIALGVNPALVGLALALPRFLDLFTDPVAGYLSDNYRRRFGRRTFIAAGTGEWAFFLHWSGGSRADFPSMGTFCGC